MNIGIGLTVQERPGTTDSDNLARATELVLLAEKLGYSGVITLEHHLTAYSLTPAPLLLLAYLAARTRRLWLATGVIVLPLWHPIHVAEQIMVLDSLANGRCLFGLGQGRATPDHGALAVLDHDATWDAVAFDESLAIIVGLLENKEVNYDGSRFKHFKGGIRPWQSNSIQRRMYCAVASDDSINIAAKYVQGVLLATDDPRATQTKCRFERAVLRSGRDPIRPIVVARAHYDENAERALERASEWRRSEAEAAAGHYARQEAIPTLVDDVVGDREACIERINEISSTFDPSFVFLEFDFGGMPYDEVERSMCGFAAAVLPTALGET